MGDGLSEMRISGRRLLDHHIEEMPARSSLTHIDTDLQEHYQVYG